MKNRVWGLLAFGGALFSSAAFADSCKNIILYENGNSRGHMEESTRSFPEAPEWAANWGDFENMKYPYIRFSGQRNYRGDWTGSLVFDALPAVVQGGTLKVKVRSTQAANFGVWLSGPDGNGKISFHSLTAGKTAELEVPIADLMGRNVVEVDKVGIGLFGVPANQYTTLFVDDIVLTCSQNGELATGVENAGDDGAGVNGTKVNFDPFLFSNANPSSPVREGLFEDVYDNPVKSRYTQAEQESLRKQTEYAFVIPEENHLQILNVKEADSLTAKKSWRGWYNSLFLVEKGALKQGVIPNSKRIFEEAETIASISDFTTLPVLLADLDYGVAYCGDSACAKREIEGYRLTLAGFPTSFVKTSQVRLVYDPYFTVAPDGKLPRIEFCTAVGCLELTPKSEGILEFESAGLQKILVKIHLEKQTLEQKLFVEVR